ncbi:leucyl/phenylalanyl-tRNA--protein transferase [Novosphingobium sp. G106]|uniref:leucyl/phenylalanyl-tRNA--protein transferase n=1 Tax=Novosphingobium sp. G106 TaxID=2849500 RepID=UPI001C2D2272|nr:leucyl/phenylalanyl-tRNA--protein transferase [Novosphingobium sp. G106]MBV1688686.1 leucyl/phenylalanyl-tRNA--protein transferase [Novosphingobium sp. G106]
MTSLLPLCYSLCVHAPVTPPIIDPELLMLAYRSGIFPMADHRDDPEIFWVEPRKRAILPLDGFHLSRSLARTLRRGRFSVTCNAAFAEVMEACAAPRRDGSGESWISHRIAASYQRLHELGQAHSLECWRDDEHGTPRLVGGLYGVGFDRVFCGESMFSRVPDASKVALAWLVAALCRAGTQLLDCQFITSHLASLGAVEISQKRYVGLLRAAQEPYSGVGVAAGARDGDGLGAGVGVAAGEAAGDGDGDALGLAAGFAALLAAAAGSSSSPGNFIAQSLTQTS